MNGPKNGSSGAAHDDPFADPIASSTPPPSPLVDESSASLPSGNDGAHTGTTPPAPTGPRRVSAASVDRIRDRLSDRDRDVLRSVGEHQFMTSQQIERLHFATVAPSARGRIARRALARLRDLRVLDTLERRIGGSRAGSAGFIYHVGVAGARILAGSGRGGGRLRYEPTTRFVDHRLAIADAHIALTTASRAGRFELVDSAIETASWRRFTGIGSARCILKPDLFAETATREASGQVRAWFIEVDLGSEHIPTVLTKCREYEAYRQTGIEQDRHGAFPIVVWSMTHQVPEKAARRRQALTEAIAADRHLPGALFRIVAPQQLLPLIERGGAL
nr:replication-relaxation family protein [Gordonia aichiensis]